MTLKRVNVGFKSHEGIVFTGFSRGWGGRTDKLCLSVGLIYYSGNIKGSVLHIQFLDFAQGFASPLI